MLAATIIIMASSTHHFQKKSQSNQYSVLFLRIDAKLLLFESDLAIIG